MTTSKHTSRVAFCCWALLVPRWAYGHLPLLIPDMMAPKLPHITEHVNIFLWHTGRNHEGCSCLQKTEDSWRMLMPRCSITVQHLGKISINIWTPGTPPGIPAICSVQTQRVSETLMQGLYQLLQYLKQLWKGVLGCLEHMASHCSDPYTSLSSGTTMQDTTATISPNIDDCAT